MAEYPQKLQDLLDGFVLIEDRSTRIQLLIDTADRFREVPERIAVRPFPDERKAPNCESEAYVFTEAQPDGTLKLHFAVENPQGLSAKAMAVILDETLSGQPPEDVARVTGDFVFSLFGNELSMGKSMGLMGMISMVTAAARRQARSTGRSLGAAEGDPPSC